MEITLEKIEIVKDRTGVSYKEAKEALEHNDGSVVDAIIEIEELINIDGENYEEDVKTKIFNKVKETAEKGNMSRIIIKKDDDVILNLPLTVGVLGAVIAPWGVIFGTIAAFGFNCHIEFVNDKGQTTDVNGKVKSGYDKAVEKGKDVYGKGQETFVDLKEKAEGTIEDFKDNYGDKFESIRDVAGEKFEQIKDSEKLEEIKNKGKEFIEKKLKPAKKEAEEELSELDEVIEEIANENGIDLDDHK